MNSRDNEYIQTWLRVNRLVDDIDDEQLLKKCVNRTIGLFGDGKDFLHLLSRIADKKRLQSMHDLIKNEKIQYKNQQNIMELDNDNKSEIKPDERSYFLSLPNESITNICQYLSKTDINSFKLTSRQIGIICLAEQQKLLLFIIDVNKFIVNNPLNIYRFLRGKKQGNRYNATKRFHCFFEEWSKKYQVPEQCQLLTSVQELQLINPTLIRFEQIQSHSNRLLMLFDIGNIIILNKNESRVMNEVKDKFDTLKDYKLMILEYFDVINQEIKTIQFILYHKDMTLIDLLEYIEYKFVYIDEINNEWHQQLLLILKEMQHYHHDNVQEAKLCFFRHKWCKGGYVSMERTDILCEYMTFQINYNHPWFCNTDKLDKAKITLKGYEWNAKQFYIESKICRKVRYIGTEIPKRKVSKKKKLKTNQVFILNMKYNALSGFMRIKLAERFRTKINPYNIELFSNENMRIPWNKRLSEYHGNSKMFDIVSYDTKHFDDTKQRIYSIKIHLPKQCPFPYFVRTENEEIKTFSFIYHNSAFEPKALIDAMFMKIKNLENDLMKKQYKESLDLYLDTDYDEYLTQQIYRKDRFYEKNVDEIKAYKNGMYIENKTGGNEIIRFDLFMVRTKLSQILSHKNKVRIRFISNWNQKFTTKTRIDEIESIKYVGLPLIAWVDEYDTLQDIIDNYVHEKVKPYIRFTYRMINIPNNLEIVSIARGKRNTYYPYNNELIIITFSKLQGISFGLPQYSDWVYQ